MVSNLCLQFVYQIQNVYLIMTAAVKCSQPVSLLFSRMVSSLRLVILDKYW